MLLLFKYCHADANYKPGCKIFATQVRSHPDMIQDATHIHGAITTHKIVGLHPVSELHNPKKIQNILLK
jgi:hypothetical protein